MILKFMELAQRRLHSVSTSGNGMDQMEVIDLKKASKSKLCSLWKHFDCIRDNGLLGIRGSLNLGNTCYLQAVIQCFIHNDNLRNYYLSGIHSSRCKISGKKSKSNKSNVETIGCVSCELEELYSDFYCGLNNAPVPITKLIGTMWKYPQYQLNNQMMHDSHELFIALTSLLCRTSSERSDDERTCQCIVHSTFRGLWCSELNCRNCQYVSSTLDTFMEINLQFRRRDIAEIHSVEDALREYMESEEMPDYKCSKCGETECTKDMTIHSLPQTLCLHLKRFEADEMMKELSASAKATGSNSTNSRSVSPNVTTRNTRSRRGSKNGKESNGNGGGHRNSNGNGSKNGNGNKSSISNGNGNGNGSFGNGNGGYQKMEEQVHFPVDTVLDLSQFVNVNRKGAKVNNKEYRLKSMIMHSGDMSAGHYVCWIRKEDQWYFCDDNSVQLSNTDYVKSAKAYMLFYEAQ